MKALREPLPKIRARIARMRAPLPPASVPVAPGIIGTFWMGGPLWPVMQLCLRTWLRHGYAVEVYSYAPVEGLPKGCLPRDAREILPEDRIDRLHGRPSAVADIFRLHLLHARADLVWCDTDLLLLRPLPPAHNILIGREPIGPVCNAVLWVRPETKLLAPLIAAFRKGGISAWSHWRVYAQRLSGMPADALDYPMHHWGRHALEYAITKHELRAEVLPPKTFYDHGTYDDRYTRAETPWRHLLEDVGVHALHLFWKRPETLEIAEPGSFWHWAATEFGEN